MHTNTVHHTTLVAIHKNKSYGQQQKLYKLESNLKHMLKSNKVSRDDAIGLLICFMIQI